MKNKLYFGLLLLVAGCSGAAFSQRNPLMDTVEMYEKRQAVWIKQINECNRLLYGQTPNPIPAYAFLPPQQPPRVRITFHGQVIECDIYDSECTVERRMNGGDTWIRILK